MYTALLTTMTRNGGCMMLRVRDVSILLSTSVMLLAFVAGLALAESPEKTAAKDKTTAPEIQKGATEKIEYSNADKEIKKKTIIKRELPPTFNDGEGQII